MSQTTYSENTMSTPRLEGDVNETAEIAPLYPNLQASLAQIQPQQKLIYVDQNGNRIQATPAQQVIYVDQFGNPIQAQAAPNVQFVQKVQASPSNSMVKNVNNINDLNINQKPPEMNAANDASRRCQRFSACILGITALALMICGILLNTLATRYYHDYSVTTVCGFNTVKIKMTDNIHGNTETVTYTDLCIKNYDLSSYDIDESSNNWCRTTKAGNWTLITLIASTAFLFIGILLVQTCCQIEPCVCKKHKECACSNWMLIISFLLVVSSCGIWLIGDNVCIPNEGGWDDLVGATIWLQMFACGFILMAACFARG